MNQKAKKSLNARHDQNSRKFRNILVTAIYSQIIEDLFKVRYILKLLIIRNKYFVQDLLMNQHCFKSNHLIKPTELTVK